jgi:hypothetical protein
LKLGECGKNFQNKYGQLIQMVLMNTRTLFDVFCSTFHINWKKHEEYGNKYTFDTLCGLLINDQKRLLEERNLGSKHQAHLLKGKENINYKEK